MPGAGAAGLAGEALVIAIRAADLVSPCGRPLAGGDRAALVVAGTPQIRTGDQVVFVKVVAVAPAVVRRDGRVQAGGHPADHARLGALEQQLDDLLGPGVTGEIAGQATLTGKVKGKARRAMTAALAIRASILMALMPDADYGAVMTALLGDLALMPWQRQYQVPPPRWCPPGGPPWVPLRWPGCRIGCWPRSPPSTVTMTTGQFMSASRVMSCGWARSTGR